MVGGALFDQFKSDKSGMSRRGHGRRSDPRTALPHRSPATSSATAVQFFLTLRHFPYIRPSSPRVSLPTLKMTGMCSCGLG